MRLNTALVISLITLVVGFLINGSYLWIPISVFIASIIDLFTRSWYMSDRLGSARNFSMILKTFFSLLGFYAGIGQIICVGLMIYWFV